MLYLSSFSDTHTHTRARARTHTHMKRGCYFCCNFLCGGSATHLKYHRIRLSCLPFVLHFFSSRHTHTHTLTHNAGAHRSRYLHFQLQRRSVRKTSFLLEIRIGHRLMLNERWVFWLDDFQGQLSALWHILEDVTCSCDLLLPSKPLTFGSAGL